MFWQTNINLKHQSYCTLYGSNVGYAFRSIISKIAHYKRLICVFKNKRWVKAYPFLSKGHRLHAVLIFNAVICCTEASEGSPQTLVYPPSFLSFVYRCIHSRPEAPRLTRFVLNFCLEEEEIVGKSSSLSFSFPLPFCLMNVTHSTLIWHLRSRCVSPPLEAALVVFYCWVSSCFSAEGSGAPGAVIISIQIFLVWHGDLCILLDFTLGTQVMKQWGYKQTLRRLSHISTPYA